MLTPLPTAEVIQLRSESKQRHIEHLERRIAAKEREVADLGYSIWLDKLELEGLKGSKR